MEITREYRKKVGERIKAERDRIGLTQKEFAKKVGLANQTYNNLENGIGSLKIEHLYGISEKCGCDIGYLLGECEERTYKATDICKETGLSEEAIEKLREAKEYYEQNKDVYSTMFHTNYWLFAFPFHTFISVINDMITTFDLSEVFNSNHERGRSDFPINKIVRYIVEGSQMKQIENHEYFSKILELRNKFSSNNHTLVDKDTGHILFTSNEMTIDSDITEELRKEITSERDIRIICNETNGFLAGYVRMRENRFNEKMDIQNDFNKYMESDFIEGEVNGK